MFRTIVKVRHSRWACSLNLNPLCYGSSTNTNPRLSIRCWSGGCCFISLCSAICGVSVISRKSAMSRPLAFCSSVALSSSILLMTLKSATYRVYWDFACKATKFILLYTSNPQPIGFSGILLAKRQKIILLYIILAQQKRRRHKIPLPHKAT